MAETTVDVNRPNGAARVASGLNFLVGLWLLISPFVMRFNGTEQRATWDAVILGVIVAILALVRLFNHSRATVWASWVNVVLGLWLIISPFVLGIADRQTMTDIVLVGIAVVVLSVIGALTSEHALGSSMHRAYR